MRRDISPLEQASRQDLADRVARHARYELALGCAIKALREINAHHAWQNAARKRPIEQSHTCNTASRALENIKKLLEP